MAVVAAHETQLGGGEWWEGVGVWWFNGGGWCWWVHCGGEEDEDLSPGRAVVEGFL